MHLKVNKNIFSQTLNQWKSTKTNLESFKELTQYLTKNTHKFQKSTKRFKQKKYTNHKKIVKIFVLNTNMVSCTWMSPFLLGESVVKLVIYPLMLGHYLCEEIARRTSFLKFQRRFLSHTIKRQCMRNIKTSILK